MESIRPREGEDIFDIWPQMVVNGGDPLQEKWCGTVNLGNGTAFTVYLTWFEQDDDSVLFIGVEGHGAYPFCSFVHWTYAAVKLGLMEGDAANIADFINRQLGHLDDPVQGDYDVRLCQR